MSLEAADELMKRLGSHKGVTGIVVVNSEKVPVRSTLNKKASNQFADLLSKFADKARSVVRDLDPSNDLIFLRIQSKKYEMMVAPDKDFMLIVAQSPLD